MLYKSVFLLTLLALIPVFSLSSQAIKAEGEILNYKSADSSVPMAFLGGTQTDAAAGLKFNPSDVILTSEGQLIDILLRINDTPAGVVQLSENTDFEFSLNEGTLEIKVIYGRARFLFIKQSPVRILAKTVKAEITGTDFGFESIRKKTHTQGYFIVFDGSVSVRTLGPENQSVILNQWEKAVFQDYKILSKSLFTREDLFSWKESKKFITPSLPSEIKPVLETLMFPENKQIVLENTQETAESETETADLTSDQITEDASSDRMITDRKGKVKLSPLQIALSFLSFETGGIGYNISMNDPSDLNRLGIRFIWRPNAILLGNKLEFGFYFNLNFYPAEAVNQNYGLPMFGSVNHNTRWINQEWSFGTEYPDDPGRMAFDIIDDILLKLRVIRVNEPEDLIYFNSGMIHDISDPYQFLFSHFNDRFYELFQRKFSIYNSYQLSFMKAFIYAEEAMPKGIYGGMITFHTPSESFRFSGSISGFADTYNAIQFHQEKWILPTAYSLNLAFDSLNLPSFGLQFFFNSGLFIPFQEQLPADFGYTVSSGLIFSSGVHMRFKDVTLTGEFVKDSKIFKIGNYDMNYTYKRQIKMDEIAAWMTVSEARTTYDDYFADHYFGGRITVNYTWLKYILIDVSYQIGVSMNYSSLADSVLTMFTFNGLYDRLMLKINLDSQEKFKLNGNIYASFNVEEPVKHLMESTFLESFQANIGMVIRPVKALDIKLQAGIYPYSDTYGFLFDASVVLKPFYFYQPVNDRKLKDNL